MDENSLVHGLLRCHNLIVSSYTPNCLKIRVSDPLGSCDIERDAAWIAPEVKQKGLHASSAASDVWAFGTCLWCVRAAS